MKGLGLSTGLIVTAFLTAGCVPPEATTAPRPVTHRLSELIIVYDNNPFANQLKTAWGFSCVVRLPEATILFDTGGDSSTLLANMNQLDIDPGEIGIVVLSHIHGDHVGGLSGFLQENNDVTVYLPRSFPPSLKDDVKASGAMMKEVGDATELLPGVYSTVELDGGIKEQAMIIVTSEGLVIVTGCSHPGILNIIKRAKEIVPDEEVYLAVGGWHLSGASSTQLQSIIASFHQLGVKKVAPCHCSGDETRRQFKQDYSDDYIEAGVGRRIMIPTK
jgi:7,8-dihydropterin-6-yl-methyl-4-(beta-D-ribofuranosyl)aminobenzene 5'-phosphate synthase